MNQICRIGETERKDPAERPNCRFPLAHPAETPGLNQLRPAEERAAPARPAFGG